MPLEMIEIKDPVSFYRIAKNAQIILRADPLLIIPQYRLIFYLDTRKIEDKDLARLLQSISNKLVYIESIKVVDSLKKFVDERYND